MFYIGRYLFYCHQKEFNLHINELSKILRFFFRKFINHLIVETLMSRCIDKSANRRKIFFVTTATAQSFYC